MGYFSFGKDGQQLFDAYPYGGLGEYMTAPQENCIKLPDTVSFEQGARFGYLGTAYSALKKAQVGPGKTVLIDGCSGTLGIGGVLNALAMGATKIFGTGRNAELLQDVKALAPDRIEVHAVGDGSLKDFVLEHNGGEGVDAVISTLGPGSPKETLLEALSTLARGGVLVDIGGMMEHPELDLFHLMCNQKSVSAASGSPTAKPRRCPTSPAPAPSTSPSSSTTCSRWRRSTRPSTTASPPATAASPTSSSPRTSPSWAEQRKAQGP